MFSLFIRFLIVEAMGLEPGRKQPINPVFIRVLIFRDKICDKFLKHD